MVGGCFLGSLVLGVPLGLLIWHMFSSEQPSQVRAEYTPAPRVLPPAYTTTPTPRPSPTSTPDESFDARYRQVSTDGERAIAFMQQGEFAQAIPLWDHVLDVLPEYGPAYSHRARAYLALTDNQRVLSEYEGYSAQAIRDLDRAIELDLSAGDDYYQRYLAYGNLASIQTYRVQSDMFLDSALDNLRIANQLGGGDDLSARWVAFILANLGRCDEALSHTNQLILARGPSAPASAGLNTALAKAYLCNGDVAQALQHIELAMHLRPSTDRRWIRSIILYNLGRLREAQGDIDSWIDADPYYSGYRYYLRALIQFELGDTEAARSDLEFGAGQTWGMYGLASYVRGLLARPAGDAGQAVEHLLMAEATITREYGPLLDRVRAELLALGGEPLQPVLVPGFAATPIPTPGVFPTQTPFGAVPMPTPTTINLTAIDQGSPWFEVQPDYTVLWAFEPQQPLTYSSVEAVTVFVEMAPDNPDADVQVLIWSPLDGSIRVLYPEDGVYSLDHPDFYVSPEGRVIVGADYLGGEASIVLRLGVSLEIRMPDGQVHTIGLPREGYR